MTYSSTLGGVIAASLLAGGIAGAQTTGLPPTGMAAADMTCATFLELGMADQAAALLPRLSGGIPGTPGTDAAGPDAQDDPVGEFSDMTGPTASDAASPSADMTSSDAAAGSDGMADSTAAATPQATGAADDADLALVPVVGALFDECGANPDATMIDAVQSARETARAAPAE